MKQSQAWCGSTLTIEIFEPAREKDFDICFDFVSEFEQTYSRFIPGNYLDTLNIEKNSAITQEFFSIINICQKVSELTQGHFDITLLPLLENKWYGIQQEHIPEDIGYQNIVLTPGHIELQNNVSLDIGSVWKWYLVDKIYNYLIKKYQNFIIDFGGDIRVSWSHVIALEDPADTTQSLWSIRLNNMSIASSAGNRRVFHNAHHLINPKTKMSIQDKTAVFITHELSTFSDIFSTALFVSPVDISIKILNSVPGLEWMILMDDWVVHKTQWFWKE